MGTPAQPSPQDRAATRALAAAVIDAVCADEQTPTFRHDDGDAMADSTVLFNFAQEIAELVKERDDARKWGDTLVGDIAELESGRMWHEAATERERIRELLIRACDALETEGLEETAAEIRQQGGAFK